MNRRISVKSRPIEFIAAPSGSHRIRDRAARFYMFRRIIGEPYRDFSIHFLRIDVPVSLYSAWKYISTKITSERSAFCDHLTSNSSIRINNDERKGTNKRTKHLKTIRIGGCECLLPVNEVSYKYINVTMMISIHTHNIWIYKQNSFANNNEKPQ